MLKLSCPATKVQAVGSTADSDSSTAAETFIGECPTVDLSVGGVELLVLGHVVDKHRVRPDPSKISAVVDWPAPSTVREARAFLGLAGYYSHFVPNFAKIARPMNALLTGISSGRKVEWTEECQSCKSC